MKVSLTVALVVVLAASASLAAAGASDEADRKAVALLRASDRDEAALENTLVTAIADGAKLQGPGPDTTQQALKRLLGALRAYRGEKAGILDVLARARQGTSEAERIEEEQKRAMATRGCPMIQHEFEKTVIAVVAAIVATSSYGSTDHDRRLLPVFTAVVVLTATLHDSLSKFPLTTGPKGNDKAVASALAATSQANAAARQAQARLQAAPRLQTPSAGAPKPLSNPLLPSPSPKSPSR